MKRIPILVIILIVSGVFLFTGGCAKVSPPPWASARFAGKFSGNETCLLNGSLPNTLHIVSTGPAQVSIANLYGLTKAVNGSISNDSCVIQLQLNGNYVLRA